MFAKSGEERGSDSMWSVWSHKLDVMAGDSEGIVYSINRSRRERCEK